MPAPISVIIPTRNAAATLPATLHALMEGVEAELIREVIIVDCGSQDGTSDLADDWGATLVNAPPSRGGQLRAGAVQAKGDWFLFLHADTVLSDGWSSKIHLGDGEIAQVFKLAFRATAVMARVTAGWANLRTRVFGLPYGDQGLLISKNLYAQVGGYPDQPLMEDVALARRLKSIRVVDAFARTGAEKYIANGWVRQGGQNLWRLIRYLFGVSPERLNRRY